MNPLPGYRGFKDLQCWIKGRQLRIEISKLTKAFPKEEKFMLISQLKRSSRSITNNISEGYGRFSFTDTRHFFIQARGSVAETMDHLSIALDENYITQEIYKSTEELCETVFRLINGYITYLDKQKAVTPNT